MTNRRDFLKSFVRLTLFGGLALGGAHLSLRENPVGTQDKNCTGNGACRKCPLLKKCAYPRAISFKEDVK